MFVVCSEINYMKEKENKSGHVRVIVFVSMLDTSKKAKTWVNVVINTRDFSIRAENNLTSFICVAYSQPHGVVQKQKKFLGIIAPSSQSMFIFIQSFTPLRRINTSFRYGVCQIIFQTSKSKSKTEMLGTGRPNSGGINQFLLPAKSIKSKLEVRKSNAFILINRY